MKFTRTFFLPFLCLFLISHPQSAADTYSDAPHCSFSMETPFDFKMEDAELIIGDFMRDDMRTFSWLPGVDKMAKTEEGAVHRNGAVMCSQRAPFETTQFLIERTDNCTTFNQLFSEDFFTKDSTCSYGSQNGYFYKSEVNSTPVGVVGTLYLISQTDLVLVHMHTENNLERELREIVDKVLETVQTSSPLDLTHVQAPSE